MDNKSDSDDDDNADDDDDGHNNEEYCDRVCFKQSHCIVFIIRNNKYVTILP